MTQGAATARRIRVLVVEDSATMRARLCEVLGGDPQFEVVGQAESGERAVELCAALRPDVVTMDMMLNGMHGLGATEHIMGHCPTPILIVSSSTNRGELFKTYDALAAGAVDVLEKPSGSEPDGAWEEKLRSALRLVSRIRVIMHPRARLGALGRSSRALASSAPGPACERERRTRLVALGASTGGPGAIVEVLRALPVGFPLPVLVVLHLGEPFGAAFADWLDRQTPHRVAYPRDGDSIAASAGRVLLAPPDMHLAAVDGRVRLTRDARRHSCRPSVDVLFESIARECGSAGAAALLTGMGRDGAAGLLDLRKAGALTIAQDEATSVVYGMPREAVLLGAAERVLPLGEIGPALAALAGQATYAREAAAK